MSSKTLLLSFPGKALRDVQNKMPIAVLIYAVIMQELLDVDVRTLPNPPRRFPAASMLEWMYT